MKYAYSIEELSMIYAYKILNITNCNSHVKNVIGIHYPIFAGMPYNISDVDISYFLYYNSKSFMKISNSIRYVLYHIVDEKYSVNDIREIQNVEYILNAFTKVLDSKSIIDSKDFLKLLNKEVNMELSDDLLTQELKSISKKRLSTSFYSRHSDLSNGKKLYKEDLIKCSHIKNILKLLIDILDLVIEEPNSDQLLKKKILERKLNFNQYLIVVFILKEISEKTEKLSFNYGLIHDIERCDEYQLLNIDIQDLEVNILTTYTDLLRTMSIRINGHDGISALLMEETHDSIMKNSEDLINGLFEDPKLDTIAQDNYLYCLSKVDKKGRASTKEVIQKLYKKLYPNDCCNPSKKKYTEEQLEQAYYIYGEDIEAMIKDNSKDRKGDMIHRFLYINKHLNNDYAIKYFDEVKEWMIYPKHIRIATCFLYSDFFFSENKILDYILLKKEHISVNELFEYNIRPQNANCRYFEYLRKKNKFSNYIDPFIKKFLMNLSIEPKKISIRKELCSDFYLYYEKMEMISSSIQINNIRNVLEMLPSVLEFTRIIIDTDRKYCNKTAANFKCCKDTTCTMVKNLNFNNKYLEQAYALKFLEFDSINDMNDLKLHLENIIKTLQH